MSSGPPLLMSDWPAEVQSGLNDRAPDADRVLEVVLGDDIVAARVGVGAGPQVSRPALLQADLGLRRPSDEPTRLIRMPVILSVQKL